MEARQIVGDGRIERVRSRLGRKSVVLVGMMGAGKTSIGRRLAGILRLPFVDADNEIEKAANLTVPEIFAQYGEAHFREGERRVMARLLANGPSVLATGGGAFMSHETREACREHGITIWLQADVSVLLERVRKKGNRPLLSGPDPEGTLRRILLEREKTYALADLSIRSRDGPHHALVAEIIGMLDAHMSERTEPWM